MLKRIHPRTNQNVRRKPLIIASVTLLVIAIALAIYFVTFHKSSSQQRDSQTVSTTSPRPSNTVDYGPSQPTDNAANDSRKDNPANASPTLNYGSTPPPASTSNATVTITRAGRVNDTLQVGTLISGATSGTCTMTASQSGQSNVERTAAVTQDGNSYTCPVFSIPLSQFPNQKDWNISVSLTANNASVSTNWAANPVNLSQ